MPDKGLWAIRLLVAGTRTTAELAAIETALEAFAVAQSRFEAEGGKAWQWEALCERRPDRRAVQAALAGVGAPPASFDYVAARDWVAESQRRQPPIRAGRFFVHGSHHKDRPPRGSMALLIDAGVAFGTGRHETTRGCLLVLDGLARAGRKVGRPLDLGCGSGILALAMAKLWPVPVLAADNDPQAVAVARENAVVNGVDGLVRAVRSHGFAATALKRAAPFDLIVANILARPLCRLAPGFARHLAPGGLAVLSGLLVEQEDMVIAAQARQGLRLRRRQRDGDWSVLVFAQPMNRKLRLPSGNRRT